MVAVSVFDALLLLWLGLTVLVNAERRTAGVWLAGSGMLLGGAFFAGHTAMLYYSLQALISGIASWWYWGWAALIALPLAWYGLMLWCSGFWDGRASTLYRRHRWGLGIVSLLALSLAGFLIGSNPLAILRRMGELSLGAASPVGVLTGGATFVVLIYPLYIVACIALSLDALRRPAPSGHLISDMARRRARPWLMATTAMQLVVSLLIMSLTLSLVGQGFSSALDDLYDRAQVSVDWFDLVICSLIGASVVLMGKPIVSYEIFTGKTLPRRGFLQWRHIVIIAALYSGLVAAGMESELQPLYPLLLTTMLTGVFFALWSWRFSVERERGMERLRPFVASQGLYESLLSPASSAEDGAMPSGTPQDPAKVPIVDAATPFRALCADVLDASQAHLIALGSLAPLVGPALSYPDGAVVSSHVLPALMPHLDSPQTMCVPLQPERHGGAQWAIPLWSERGLIGVLLLGQKAGGALYTQEEIEIARASGERLIDTQASAALARRLMDLQQQRLAESQVLDRRARRTLHDDVLPRLHAAMLALSAAPQTPAAKVSNGADTPAPNAFTPNALAPDSASDTLAALADAHRLISDLLRDTPPATAPQIARLGVLGALRQTVETELRGAFDGVTWQSEPNEQDVERKTRAIPALAREVVFYAAREAMRNAARHGRGADDARALHARVIVRCEDKLEIAIEDDGAGLSAGEPRHAPNGSGHGLALHGTMMAVVGGTLAIESAAQGGTRVVLGLPLPVESGAQSGALGMER